MIEPFKDENLVQKLVERGEDLTLKKLVEYTYYCGMNGGGLLGGKGTPAWIELFEPLREAIDKAYPGEVSWDVIYCLQKGDHANEVISPDIKAKYIRIWLFSNKSKSAEIQKSFYKDLGETPEEPAVTNNS